MDPAHTCPECGAKLPANAPQGLCPRCLAKMGLGLLHKAALPESDLQVERTGTMIGRYKLLEKIGEGGFGVVYMAEQVEPVQRKVALKIIKAGMDTKEVIARFEAERQAIALMDHPNIARALDAGATQAGRPYFVMELVRGIPITDYCDRANLATQERLELFMQVCRAVQHAHQKGVIHRDIKPGNVLVTEHDGKPVPKVIDFGVAKALGQKLTEKTLFTGFQHMIGTPAYMSPEQAALSGLDVDTRADIYSLGVMLYELLTGVTPFDAETFRKAALDEIRKLIQETDPPKPSTRLQTLGERLREVAKQRRTEPAALSRLVRGDLDWIVMKCLEKDRQRRYETANGLAVDIERHLKSEPVVARPPSNVYRFRKLVRRHKVAVAALTAITVVLALGAVLSTWQALRAKSAERQAKDALAQVQIQTAARFFAANDYSTALAYLARVLRQNPANEGVAALVFSNLTTQNFLVPSAKPLVHTGAVFFARFSPDGGRVVTASGDGTARIWDATTGRLLAPPLCHSGPVDFAQFSPDGRLVATASEDNTVGIWNGFNGKPVRSPLVHPNSVGWVYFSPDGERLITSTRPPDGSVRVWDPWTGRLLTEPIARVPRLRCNPFSPDSRQLVLPEGTNTWIRDARTAEKLVGPFNHNGIILSAEFSSDGTKILIASSDGVMRIWEAETGRPITSPINHGRPLWLARFSPDDQRVVSVCQDDTVQIWSASTGRALTGPLSSAEAHDVYPSGRRYPTHGWLPTKAAQFSPDGSMVVVALLDSAKLLDSATGQGLVEPLRHGAVTSAEFSSDSQRLITASRDGTARIWGIRKATDQQWVGTVQSRSNHAARVFTPVPDWVPRLLESLAEKRVNDQGEVLIAASSSVLSRDLANDVSADEIIPLIVLQEVPLSTAVHNLATQAKLSCVLDPSVTNNLSGQNGKAAPEPIVSIRLENVTARQALLSVLNSNNLVIRDDPTTHTLRIIAKHRTVPDSLNRKVTVPGDFDIEDLELLRQHVLQSSKADSWTRWGKWLLAGGAPQPLSPR